MLAAMFAPGSSRAPGILTDGAFFIDRDPKVFEVIFLLCKAKKIYFANVVLFILTKKHNI